MRHWAIIPAGLFLLTLFWATTFKDNARETARRNVGLGAPAQTSPFASDEMPSPSPEKVSRPADPAAGEGDEAARRLMEGILAASPAPEMDVKMLGNAANCKKSGNFPYPECNWWDAMAYCGGRLPTVAQLQAAYKSECTGGRKSQSCGHWYWSSEESGASHARHVHFDVGGVHDDHKGYNYGHVRCAR